LPNLKKWARRRLTLHHPLNSKKNLSCYNDKKPQKTRNKEKLLLKSKDSHLLRSKKIPRKYKKKLCKNLNIKQSESRLKENPPSK